MGKETNISWCDMTFNPYWGCEKSSPACLNCYAEAWSKRCGFDCFGPGKPARVFGEAHWNEPMKWNRQAEKLNTRYKVFCGSMCDLFQERWDINPEREKLWKMVEETPNLIWMFLTKHPENIDKIIHPRWKSYWPRNVWLGVTAENQEEANWRVPIILQFAVAKTFLSCEPLLGRIDLNAREWLIDKRRFKLTMSRYLDWVIVGGESGPGARPMHPDWARSLRDQCVEVGVPFHFKQWGEWAGYGQAPAANGSISCAVHEWGNLMVSMRIGKRRSGHMLDGVEYLPLSAGE